LARCSWWDLVEAEAMTTIRERREKIRREVLREAMREVSLNAVHAGSEYLKSFYKLPRPSK